MEKARSLVGANSHGQHFLGGGNADRDAEVVVVASTLHVLHLDRMEILLLEHEPRFLLTCAAIALVLLRQAVHGRHTL